MTEIEMKGRTEYLSRYFDPELTPPKTTAALLEQSQIERLSRSLVVVVIAGSIPRRLGGDATDQDLAIDKKRSKRVSWALKQSVGGWTKKVPKLDATDEARVDGAQLIWDSWYEAYMNELTNQTKLLVTWSILNDERRWGRSAVVKLENERNWVSYAMRD